MKIQKKLASRILKCGANRIWVEPSNEKVMKAITRKDIRRFIKEGIIKKLPVKINRGKKNQRQQMEGSRRGTRKVRLGPKTQWLKMVRPQRKMIKELRKEKKIDSKVYRKLYKLIKGGYFKSKARLDMYMKEKGMTKK